MAKAKPGRRYAQIINGRAHWFFTHIELPEWNDEHAPAIDVTDLDPQPSIGDRYVDGAFLPAKTDDELREAARREALANLVALDHRTIRAMREYIATQPDAPESIKAVEVLAAAERKKL